MDGQVQVYEIKTNPTTKPPQEHPRAIRNRTQQLAWEKYCAALSALDTTDPDGPFAASFEHRHLIRRPVPSGYVDVQVNRY